MASFNRVILVGNLTRDPELRYTPSNTAVTEIGMAVNDRRKSASGVVSSGTDLRTRSRACSLAQTEYRILNSQARALVPDSNESKLR